MKCLRVSLADPRLLLHTDLHVEGLFRVPGNSVRQQALKELLNSGADVDLESGDFHPNDVATLLKTFLGELPEPLLTHSNTELTASQKMPKTLHREALVRDFCPSYPL
uniref:Rho-GAP domain-containing protein n=1 Tax=Stegastes partitus TaxID=144197 RepID=A0A3B5A3X5_9TELE